MSRKVHADGLQHSKQPLYQQLATVFRRHIESGAWERGARIPTLDALTEELVWVV